MKTERKSALPTVVTDNFYSLQTDVCAKDAFENLYQTYKQFLNTSASLYCGNVKQQVFHAKARKYASSLECAVDANNVSSSVYHNLIDTVNKNLDKMHRVCFPA